MALQCAWSFCTVLWISASYGTVQYHDSFLGESWWSQDDGSWSVRKAASFVFIVNLISACRCPHNIQIKCSKLRYLCTIVCCQIGAHWMQTRGVASLIGESGRKHLMTSSSMTFLLILVFTVTQRYVSCCFLAFAGMSMIVQASVTSWIILLIWVHVNTMHMHFIPNGIIARPNLLQQSLCFPLPAFCILFIGCSAVTFSSTFAASASLPLAVKLGVMYRAVGISWSMFFTHLVHLALMLGFYTYPCCHPLLWHPLSLNGADLCPLQVHGPEFSSQGIVGVAGSNEIICHLL